MTINVKIIIKKLVIAFVIIAICLSGYYYYIKTIHPLVITQKLISAIKAETGVSITIENSHVIPFPTPRLKVNRISTDNGIFIDNATLKLSIFSLFSGNYKINSINIDNLYTNPKKTRLDQVSYHDAIRKISAFNSFTSAFYIGKIWDTAVTNRIVASKIAISKSNQDVTLEFELQNQIKFKDEIIFSHSKNNWDSNMVLLNDNFNIAAFTTFNEKIATGGKFTGDLKNLSAVIRDTSPYFDFIINKNIRTTEPVKISGRVTNSDQFVVIDQIDIEGKNIQANATYWLAQNDDDVDTLQIQFTKLDISALTHGSDQLYSSQDTIFKLDTTKLRMIVSATNIELFGDSLQQFKLDSLGDGSTFKILSCAGKIASGGDFTVFGQINHNKYRPRFEGNIVVNHNNINDWISKTRFANLASQTPSPIYFAADLIATPIDFKMQNFKMILAMENISGNADLKLIGKDSQLIGNLEFEQLNLDTSTAPFIKNIYDYMKSLAYNMSDQNYSSKFVLLRTFPLKSILDINIDGLVAEGVDMRRVNLVTSYDSGQLRIDEYLINTSDKWFIKGDAKIIATGLKPEIKLNVYDGNVIIDNFSNDEINDFANYSKNNIALTGISLSMQGGLPHAQFGGLKFKDISFEASDQNGLLNVSKLNLSYVDGGEIQLSANLVFSPLRISIAYGVDALNLHATTDTLFPQKLPFASGVGSFNGQLFTTGMSVNDLLYNLYITGSFLAKDISISGMSMEDLITKLSVPNFDPSTIDAALNNAINTGSSQFSEIKGSYDLNDGIITINDTVFSSPVFTGSAGIALNIYDCTMDLNSIFSFFPVGAKIINPKFVPPIKLSFQARGNIFTPDKLLRFSDINDISRIQTLLKGPYYEDNKRNNRRASF